MWMKLYPKHARTGNILEYMNKQKQEKGKKIRLKMKTELITYLSGN